MTAPPGSSTPIRVGRDPIYDRFWDVVDEVGAPITLHILTGRILAPLALVDTQTPEERGENPCGMLDLFSEIQGVLANLQALRRERLLSRIPASNVV